ncbi:TolC family protein [Clostridium sp. BJN0013]|uniref:TolC family protein n=1 Tax=Clostridium sp. BJN0013 TaxID=3236840 RepID=UPI0034C69D59
MNKIKILATAVVLSFCTSTMAFAQGNTLDIDSLISNNIDSTYKVKNADISIRQAQNSYNKAVKNAGSSGSQLNGDLSSSERYQLMKTIANAPKEAKFSIYKYTNEKEVAKNEVKLAAYTEYQTVMNSKDSLDLQQQEFSNAEEQYKSAQLKLNLGIMSQADVKQAEISYYDAKAQLNKAQREYDLQIMNLNKVFDIDVYVKYDVLLKDKITESPYIRSYDDYVNDALKNRAEILNNQENINLQKFEFNIIRGVYPSKYDAMYKIGQYNVEQANDTLDLNKITITTEINNLYNDLQVKSKMLDSKKDTFALAQRNYDTALAKYNAGVLSKIDFDSQSVNLKSAQNDLKSLQRDIWMAQFKLNLACGIGSDTSKIIN